MNKDLDWLFSDRIKIETKELFQNAKSETEFLLSERVRHTIYRIIRDNIHNVISNELETFIENQTEDIERIQVAIKTKLNKIKPAIDKLVRQLSNLNGISSNDTEIEYQILNTLEKSILKNIIDTVEFNLTQNVSNELTKTISATFTEQIMSVIHKELKEQKINLWKKISDTVTDIISVQLNNVKNNLSFQIRDLIQDRINVIQENIVSEVQEALQREIKKSFGRDLSVIIESQLQKIIQDVTTDIGNGIRSIIDNTIRELSFDTSIHNTINEIFSGTAMNNTITELANETLNDLVEDIVSSISDIIINKPNTIASTIKKMLNKELYASAVNVTLFAFTQTNSYDLSTKIIQIITELEYGRLPVVTIRFVHLTNEELEVLTDKAAGITLHITDSENNVLFTVPTLLPTEIVNVSTAETRFKHVTIRYLPQWQFDMLYRQTVFFTINTGEQLSAKIRRFCSNRFIYIIDKESLNNITVNRTLQITNEPVIQVFKTLDSYYRIYRPDLYPNAQILIPYTAISLPIDGTESLITMILAPLEYRQFVYDEIIDKRPFFIKTLPAYDREAIDTKKLIEQFFDPKTDRIFMSLDGTQNMNQQFLAEAIKRSIHPEQFPTNDIYRGKLELIKTEENIDKYIKLEDEYRMTFGKGQHTMQHNFAEQLRQIFSQLSFPKIRLDSAFVPLSIEYYKSLPTILPGIQVKYLLVNPLDEGRFDIQAGYGQLNKISWIWNRSGDKLSSGSIQLNDIEIKQVQTIQLE